MEQIKTYPLIEHLVCPKCHYEWDSVFRMPKKYRTCPQCAYPIKVNMI